MKHLILAALLFLLWLPKNYAQDTNDIRSFSLAKGEVLDFLLLSKAPNSEELYKRYRKTVFPVGVKYSFEYIPGFRIKKLTLGNHQPNLLILGRWDSTTKREEFLDNIVSEVPDFHDQRRALFPHFDLVYYEMPEDLEFSIHQKKYNVVTAFWKNDTKAFQTFTKNWQQAIQKAGATVRLQLKDGTSPTGYYYKPDLLYIIEWENQEAFEKFAKRHPLSTYKDLQHVHQFVIG